MPHWRSRRAPEPSNTFKSAPLLWSGQWQDMPARQGLTESKTSPLEALATYAKQLPSLVRHYQARLGITKLLWCTQDERVFFWEDDCLP